jgi:uncharacterized Zn finger protein
MDTGRGRFQMVEDGNNSDLVKALEAQHPEHGGWFHVGDVVEIRGSLFRIKSIKPTELRLKLLKRGQK